MAKYDLHTYDVWGNATDGYEVNDRHMRRDIIDIPDDATDEDIVRILKASGWINKGTHFKSIEIDGEPDHTLYVNYSPTSYPMFELERRND